MGQAASSGTDSGTAAKTLPTANDVRALLFGGRTATLTTPKSGAVSTLVFEGTVQQLQGELALTYKVTKELTQRPPTLVRRRKQLAMDDDAEELLIVAATCSLGDAKMTVLTDEPMCACVDVFDDDIRVHFVSPTNPELGGVVLIATRDDNGIALRGGDEYWWDGYPPIIHAREKTAAPAPRPAFAGSFFEKDVAVRGLQGGA
jgi:hypothetical protein